MTDAKPATEITARANAAVLEQLPFDDDTDFTNARRGLIAEATGQVMTDGGRLAWDFDRWNFLQGEAPDTVNPSLWRQGQLVSMAGLYEVIDGIYQARGFDLSVTSFLRTDNGWVVVDPLISVEPMRAAFAMLTEHVADLPVTAVICTHSHIDHYGGIRAVVSDDDLASGSVRVIAPVDFLQESVSENVMLGNAMGRRKSYMYGEIVGFGLQGSVGAGLGQVTSDGTVTLLTPTDIISETGQELTIDGLRIVFQHTPGAEAPAELVFSLPDRKALCMAEIATHNLHNLYTLRGAKIRDSLIWSKHLHESLRLFGDAEVCFSSHHWPTWGNAEIVDFLSGQRDLYRYLHDETVRLANHGYTPVEIADTITVPDSIGKRFASRGYYGSVSHNVKSTYVYYLGWFDAVPANLDPHPPVETGRRFVDYMGGAAAVLARARDDFEAGDYRWVAQVVNQVVFADPDNVAARELLADAYEQLGYQAENGTWRNFYLTGAMELRKGMQRRDVLATASPDSVRAMPVDLFLDYLAMRLHGERAADRQGRFALVLPDIDERHLLELGNGVLNHSPASDGDEVDATVTVPRTTLDEVVLGRATLDDAITEGDITIDGDAASFRDLLGLLDDFDIWFDIVTP